MRRTRLYPTLNDDPSWSGKDQWLSSEFVAPALRCAGQKTNTHYFGFLFSLPSHTFRMPAACNLQGLFSNYKLPLAFVMIILQLVIQKKDQRLERASTTLVLYPPHPTKRLKKLRPHTQTLAIKKKTQKVSKSVKRRGQLFTISKARQRTGCIYVFQVLVVKCAHSV